MAALWQGRIAVLADPHLHDTTRGADYGLPGMPMVRTLGETAQSTRVFNESGPALRAALEEMRVAGHRLVLIVGDMTDDGQAPNWRAAADVLAEYERNAGMRFFLTPGNHDQWVTGDLPQRKSFCAPQGAEISVSSQPLAGAHHAPAMARLDHAMMLELAAPFGYAPRASDLLWETPFGTDPALPARMGRTETEGAAYAVADLSYLVEPEPGLWILSIDASVYLPQASGLWRDGSSEGWRAVVQHKPWLLDWIRRVVARAEAAGKRLVSFSHYPVLDALNGVSGPEEAGGKKRLMPDAATRDAVAATGMGLHFSGHWHVNRTTLHRDAAGRALINIAVPSTVGFPAAWKEAQFQGDRLTIRSHVLREVPEHDLAHASYRAAGAQLPPDISYPAFLRWHLCELVRLRYLPRDWPQDFATELTRQDLPGLLASLGLPVPAGIEAVPGLALMQDLYLLERGGDLAGISEARRTLYRGLNLPDGLQGPAARLLTSLAAHANGPPDGDFALDLAPGRAAVSAA
ncbi:metallophosphoesterase family protein [Phaeovulum sp. W22_SRMD_FR3]|uniref:metallophosphoesterase family protein n=1 Tax=Phaeovulum sp. W22_SRMD_FR3 TaxID=3240274 RepID=UPI003F956ECF